MSCYSVTWMLLLISLILMSTICMYNFYLFYLMLISYIFQMFKQIVKSVNILVMIQQETMISKTVIAIAITLPMLRHVTVMIVSSIESLPPLESFYVVQSTVEHFEISSVKLRFSQYDLSIDRHRYIPVFSCQEMF